MKISLTMELNGPKISVFARVLGGEHPVMVTDEFFLFAGEVTNRRVSCFKMILKKVAQKSDFAAFCIALKVFHIAFRGLK